MEEYSLRFLNALMPSISRMPPSIYVGALLGIINSSLFYLGFGRGLRLFIPFLVLGCIAALIGLTVGAQLPDAGPSIGDVNLAAVTLSTWIILFVARSIRL